MTEPIIVNEARNLGRTNKTLVINEEELKILTGLLEQEIANVSSRSSDFVTHAALYVKMARLRDQFRALKIEVASALATARKEA